MIEKITIFSLFFAMAILWVFNWIVMKRIQKHEQTWKQLTAWKSWIERRVKQAETISAQTIEQRCQHCVAGPDCPGYNTGVIYPCQHYEEIGNSSRNTTPHPGC